jgi:hypothetical protein
MWNPQIQNAASFIGKGDGVGLCLRRTEEFYPGSPAVKLLMCWKSSVRSYFLVNGLHIRELLKFYSVLIKVWHSFVLIGTYYKQKKFPRTNEMYFDKCNLLLNDDLITEVVGPRFKPSYEHEDECDSWQFRMTIKWFIQRFSAIITIIITSWIRRISCSGL